MKFQLDPFNMLESDEVYFTDFMNLLGVLPLWAKSYSENSGFTLRQHMSNLYGYPLSYDDTGKMDGQFVFRYPGDPEHKPLFVAYWESGQAMAIYRYGMVSFIDYDDVDSKVLQQYHTRMD